MHHILAFNATAAAAGASENDTPAVTDPSFSVRNNHFIFTEQYELLMAAILGASVTDVRISSPSIDAIAPARLHPINRSLTAPSPLRVADFTDYPMMLPQNEEVAIKITNNLGAATEAESAFVLIAPPNWSRNVPRGIRRQLVRSSQSVTLVANAWSADTAITFTDASPRGGWYAINGAYCQCTNGQAFRLNLPRQVLVQGRKMFPGYFCQNAIDDFHYNNADIRTGYWGQFQTFEPPSLAIFGTAAGAQTAVLLLDVTYLTDQSQMPAVGI